MGSCHDFNERTAFLPLSKLTQPVQLLFQRLGLHTSQADYWLSSFAFS